MELYRVLCSDNTWVYYSCSRCTVFTAASKAVADAGKELGHKLIIQKATVKRSDSNCKNSEAV